MLKISLHFSDISGFVQKVNLMSQSCTGCKNFISSKIGYLSESLLLYSLRYNNVLLANIRYKGNNLMHVAVHKRWNKAVDRLHELTKWGVNNYHHTPLHVAVLSQNYDAIKILRNSFLYYQNDNMGKDPMHYAIVIEDLKSFDLLIYGLDVPLHKIQDYLFYAVHLGNKQLIKKLLGMGGDLNYLDNNGLSIMHYALTSDVLEFLISCGGNIKIKDKLGRSLIHYSIMNHKWSYIPMLVKYICIDDCDEHGLTALHYAVLYKKNNIIPLLIKLGASINILDMKGRTAFHYACIYGNEKVVKRMIPFVGSSINVNDRKKYTALDYIGIYKHTKLQNLVKDYSNKFQLYGSNKQQYTRSCTIEV